METPCTSKKKRSRIQRSGQRSPSFFLPGYTTGSGFLRVEVIDHVNQNASCCQTEHQRGSCHDVWNDEARHCGPSFHLSSVRLLYDARSAPALPKLHSRTRWLCVALGAWEVLMSQASAVAGVKNVVLVHGGFVDGSGWEGVYKALKRDGYMVSIVQNPTMSLADDVAVTKRTLATQNGPVILVGHSYGGAVITEAGNHPKVVGLVYVAAFAPDKGESVSALIKNPPPGAPVPPILPPQDGYLFLDKAKFPASFAADVSPDAAAFMADSQVPWGVEALGGTISEPAWKTKPSWYLLTTDDKMIPPEAQRAMSTRAGSTVVEVKGSHAVYVSQPQAVASLIEKAAKAAMTIPVPAAATK
jgi:pimeloyl-ACP methyl ester carboxylesterase